MPVVTLNRDSIKSSLSRLTAPRSPIRSRSKSSSNKNNNKSSSALNNIHGKEDFKEGDDTNYPSSQQQQQQQQQQVFEKNISNPDISLDLNDNDDDDDDDDDDDIFLEKLVLPPPSSSSSTMPLSSYSSSQVNTTTATSHRRNMMDPPSSSDNIMNNNIHNSLESKLQTIYKVYGPNANIYRDVLKVSPQATPAQIREAFFCLRYELYQKHDYDPDNNGGGGGASANRSSSGLTSDERRAMEDKMDAVAGAFHIVGDVHRRRMYDASLSVVSTGTSSSSATTTPTDAIMKQVKGEEVVTDEMGFPISNNNNNNNNNNINNNKSSPTTTSDNNNSKVYASSSSTPRVTRQLSPRQRRIMNESRRIVAQPVTSLGGLNARPSPTMATKENRFEDDNNNYNGNSNNGGGDSTMFRGGENHPSLQGRESPHWANFGNNKDDSTNPDHNQEYAGGGVEEEDRMAEAEARNTNMNLREQLLYKSHLKYHSSPHPPSTTAAAAAGSTVSASTTSSSLTASRLASRLANRYNHHSARDRGDRYAEEAGVLSTTITATTTTKGKEGPKKKGLVPSQLASPTGVDADIHTNDWASRKMTLDGRRLINDDYDYEDEEGEDRGSTEYATTLTRMMGGTTTNNSSLHYSKKTNMMKDPTTKYISPTHSNHHDDEEDQSTYASSHDDDDTRTYDDDTRTYDDDTQTYDDDTQTYDDTTIGGSTWASADDTTSYAAPYEEDDDHQHSPRHSPGHKKGNMPEPILKSGFINRGEKRLGQDTDNKQQRRVTIHSHRGRGEDNEEDFSLFEGAMCPSLLSLGALKEEVNGTYNDFTQALHQVSNAFVINPDDIDRLADKIRDAKIELGENYTRQVNERKGSVLGGGGTKELTKASGGVGGGKKKMSKKA